MSVRSTSDASTGAHRSGQHGSLERLDRVEALRLLTTSPVGRVAIGTGGAPIVLPVNFVVVGDTVVVRTGAGELLAAAVHREVIAFEVDGWDILSRTGWSVLLTGMAEEVTRPSELAEVEAHRLQPWAPGLRGHVVRLQPDAITGRRIPQLSDCPGDLPDSLLTGPDTPLGVLALRPLGQIEAAASIVEAIGTLHLSGTPIGELSDGQRELVSLAGLVRAIGSGLSPTHRRGTQPTTTWWWRRSCRSWMRCTPWPRGTSGARCVRPGTGHGAGVVTVADVLPSLLWYFDPAGHAAAAGLRRSGVAELPSPSSCSTTTRSSDAGCATCSRPKATSRWSVRPAPRRGRRPGARPRPRCRRARRPPAGRQRGRGLPRYPVPPPPHRLPHADLVQRRRRAVPGDHGGAAGYVLKQIRSTDLVGRAPRGRRAEPARPGRDRPGAGTAAEGTRGGRAARSLTDRSARCSTCSARASPTARSASPPPGGEDHQELRDRRALQARHVAAHRGSRVRGEAPQAQAGA